MRDLAAYYGMDGKPVTDRAEQIRLFSDPGARRVAETTLPNGIWVSTVLLVVDHNFYTEAGPPLIFETMVFKPTMKDGKMTGLGPELDCDRYPTKADAESGHARAVAKWLMWDGVGEPEYGNPDVGDA